MTPFRLRTLTIALAGGCAWAGAQAAGMPPESAAAAAQLEAQASAAPARTSAETHAGAGAQHGSAHGSPAQDAPAAGDGMH